MTHKILQLAFFILALPISSKSQATIQFSQIALSTADNSWDVIDRTFTLENGKSDEKVFVLTSDGKVKLTATMEVKRVKSRISQHKGQGIRLTLKYQCIMEGESAKNKTERMFWPDNDGNFTENVSFTFGKGKLKPVVATLRFSSKITFR
jgi:formylmethanofuran dehydrogenase subunit E-like metal-binding protein